MAEFLSDAWFGALETALAAVGGISSAGESRAIAVGQIVTEVPAGLSATGEGEVRYTLALATDGSASLVRGSTAQADVVLVEDWATAEAVASGRASVGDMLGAGRIKLRGDTRSLIAAGELLTRVAAVFADTGGATGSGS